MKHFKTLILCVMAFALLCAGCTPKPAEQTSAETSQTTSEQFSVFLCDASDGVMEILDGAEYRPWEEFCMTGASDPESQIVEGTTQTFSCGEMTFTGEIVFTTKLMGSYHDDLHYFGTKNPAFPQFDDTTFWVDENGTVTALCLLGLNEEEVQDNQWKTEEECEKILLEFFAKFSQIDLSEYRKTVKDDINDAGCFEFRYTKYIEDLKTCEYADFSVDKRGFVTRYGSLLLGEMSADAVPAFDEELIRPALEARATEIGEKLREQWENPCFDCEDVQYDYREWALGKTGPDSYCLICPVVVKLIFENGNGISPELLTFVVPLS